MKAIVGFSSPRNSHIAGWGDQTASWRWVRTVDEAVFDGFFTAHEIVAIGITGNDVHGLASVMGKHLVQALANGQDFRA